jgi:hypothetical protein
MRNPRRLWLFVLLCAPAWPPAGAAAQDLPKDVVYSRHSLFQIPFQAGADAPRLKQLQLFVSTDRGRSWQPSAVATPNQRRFKFEAEHDGLYWFTVQTKDHEGRYFPPTLERAQPSLKVFVDTHPPVVKLRRLPNREGDVGVAWTITDDTLDLSIPGAIRLDYRLANGVAWHPLRADPYATQYYWSPSADGGIEVRLRARDRAENWGEDRITLDGTGGGNGAGATDEVPERKPKPQPNLRSERAARMVNSKSFSLSYDVKETGPSKISTVDLWYTQDGNNWQKYRSQKCTDNPDKGPPYTIDVAVQEEGLYGFTLIVHSGVGLSDPPPQVGDSPQIWVEVDTTKPEVQLSSILVGRGSDKGKLSIAWSARDKNLAAQPITLLYKEDKGEWVKIVDKLENTGRYVWQMPAEVPYRFFVKVEAVDRAGNVGSATTPDMVAVDLSQPKATILRVEPLSK